MRRRRNLIILSVVFFALCGAALLAQSITEHVDSVNTTDEIILTLEQDELTSVSWEYEEDSLEFEKTDDIWYNTGDEDFPVNQDTLAEFLEHFEEVHACFIIEDVEDYSQYGLEEPQCTITLTTEDGDTVVSLGSYSTIDEQRYISIGDDTVYLIEDDLLEYVTTDRDEYMQHDDIPEIEALVELTVAGDATLDAVYDKEGVYSYTQNYNYYNVENGNYSVLDDDRVEDYLSALTTLSLTDYVTYTASSEDLSEYGLDDPDYTITLTAEMAVMDEEDEEETTEEDTSAAEEAEEDDAIETETKEYVLYIGTVVTDEENEDGVTEVITLAYARVGDSEIIYQLTDEDYETLSANSYDSLRPRAVLSPDWESVTGVSFTMNDATYEVSTMTRGEWNELQEAAAEDSGEGEDTEAEDEDIDEDEIIYLLSEQEIDFDTVMNAANALEIDSFTSEESSSTQELSMTVYLDSENYPSVTITIYQYDGESFLVYLDGEQVGLMERSLMVDLREAVTSIVLGLE
ncbi:MAG: DUF4340 domain-containing protein [Lachnospiraceae bacterium]|nr:DUF4340 domain-containing protein [Lachnospiraceae bacterium]